MREIRFRAWDKTTQIMYPDAERRLELFLYNRDMELMQYTGLKDKNGKEIYGGDIICIPNWSSEYRCKKCGYSNNKEGIAKIEWANEEWRGDTCSSVAKFMYHVNGNMDSYELDDAEDYEVIGNIYENHELLKEAK